MFVALEGSVDLPKTPIEPTMEKYAYAKYTIVYAYPMFLGFFTNSLLVAVIYADTVWTKNANENGPATPTISPEKNFNSSQCSDARPEARLSMKQYIKKMP